MVNALLQRAKRPVLGQYSPLDSNDDFDAAAADRLLADPLAPTALIFYPARAARAASIRRSTL